jgi:hypothetical protein
METPSSALCQDTMMDLAQVILSEAKDLARESPRDSSLRSE